ncbi:MAG: Glucokinase [Mucilaginibacter sp.]|nr:Glucokinase [Mucilaginibacter sp.]
MMSIKNIYTPYILSADIGGSHLTAAICDCKTNTVLEQSLVRVDIDSKGSAADILHAWSNALDRVLQQSFVHISGVALAVPGPFDYDHGVSFIKGFDKYESIYGVDVKNYLSNALQIHGSLIKFRNDAEATILGECIAGAGKGFNNLMGITLGTGFGSAFFKDGLISDLNLGADPYKESIADDHFSTRWFVRRYREVTGRSVCNVKELVSNPDNRKLTRMIFEEFSDNLCAFLKGPVERYEPEMIIICGNIARAGELFLPLVKDRFKALTIGLAQTGELAALTGAAALFKPAEKASASNKIPKNI